MLTIGPTGKLLLLFAPKTPSPVFTKCCLSWSWSFWYWPSILLVLKPELCSKSLIVMRSFTFWNCLNMYGMLVVGVWLLCYSHAACLIIWSDRVIGFLLFSFVFATLCRIVFFRPFRPYCCLFGSIFFNRLRLPLTWCCVGWFVISFRVGMSIVVF